MASRKKASHPKASKAVLERQTTSRHLLAKLETLASPAETPPGTPMLASLLHGLAPWLRHSITRLVALDEEVFATRARLGRARQERDTALRQLAHDVAHLRLSIENQYKTPQIQCLGFETPTPRGPVPLLRIATRVAKNLAHPELPDLLGQPWFRQPFDPATHQARLARQAEDLRHLLRQVDHLQRDLDLARSHRRQAQKEHDTLAREARRMVDSVERLGRLAQDQSQPTACKLALGSPRDPTPKPEASEAPLRVHGPPPPRTLKGSDTSQPKAARALEDDHHARTPLAGHTSPCPPPDDRKRYPNHRWPAKAPAPGTPAAPTPPRRSGSTRESSR